MTVRFWIKVLIYVLCAAPFVTVASVDGGTRILHELDTSRGVVQIVRSTATGAEWSSVVLGSQTVYKGKDEVISFDGKYKLPSGDVELVLLGISAHGASCPNLYRIVTVSKLKKPVTSEPFGNCAAPGKLSLVGETLVIWFPRLETAPGAFSSEQVWQFKSGVLSVKAQPLTNK